MVEELEEQFKAILAESHSQVKEDVLGTNGSLKKESLFDPVDTRVAEKDLRFVMERCTAIPEGFHLHPKLVKWNEERLKMLSNNSVDWGAAECLAFGTLLLEKVSIRLSGQDSQRGTFSHRHAVWIDQENVTKYFPLQTLKEGQGRFDVLNSPLSEYSVMGFDLGYSWAAPEALVLWEAQFGDFFNGAQIIVDQYLSSAEEKWKKYSSLVLLLPHALEGMGPEHSSARLERFLQLCAKETMQIVNATTPAQFFHLLRRQAKRSLKKPLIIFTPKSLLRAAACVSTLKDFTEGKFEEIIEDKTKSDRLLLCSGHIYYDLLEERKKRKPCAITRIEQLYPLKQEQLKGAMSAYTDIVWVQEEPANMGAWEFLRPILEGLAPAKAKVRYAGRVRSSSPATGSHHRHEEELKAIFEEAFQ